MKNKQILILIAGFSIILLNSCKTQETADQKVEKLLSQLTLEEKVSMIHGNTYFTTPAIPRL